MMAFNLFLIVLEFLLISEAQHLYWKTAPLFSHTYNFCLPPFSSREPRTLSITKAWEDTLPFFTLSFNVTEITSAESYFEIRTFDPEGLVFYGDTKDGENSFILAMRNGHLEVQINNDFSKVTKSGGPKINDGKWHKVNVTNVNNNIFVQCDDKDAFSVEDSGQPMMMDYRGLMRIAFGGLYINESLLVTPLRINLDACIRNWNWLNKDTPTLLNWVENQINVNKRCYSRIRTGSYFHTMGLAVFIAEAFNGKAASVDENWTFTLAMAVNPVKDNAVLLAITTADHLPLLTLILQSREKGFLLTFGNDTKIQTPFPDTLCHGSKLSLVISETNITFQQEDQATLQPIKKADYRALKEAWLDKGALFFLGGMPGLQSAFPHQLLSYFHGCIWDIMVQGQSIDLDRAYYKHDSISSHSCPALHLLDEDPEVKNEQTGLE
ncbi:sex hormone-binding globulin isoform X2 [Protopterus annectens]|uniref:sex hormone-binding globulin isoform X2 n=1 Tax=Protopterus annectens TaxID=7888 RepID=UPI001CF9D446|nr:sex hormone-binding globulin isoform X2 [Protopterus annectens]